MAAEPPPPYSETDIYSNSGSGNSPATPHREDSARSHRFSTSSAGESTIYTPPYTPEGSVHLTGSIDPVQAELSSSASALYFECRTPSLNPNGTALVHTISVSAETRHEDISYPEPESAWLEREVTKQDWATFVNYLIPHHADVSNSAVAERKLKAELLDERMDRLTLEDDRVDPRHLDALLGQLRPVNTDSAEKYMLRIGDIIAEWNEGFFGPRGLQIKVSEPVLDNSRDLGPEEGQEESMPMPGAWTDHPEEENWAGPSGRNFGGDFGRGFRGFGIGRGARVFRGGGFGRAGLRMPGMAANNGGFRMGNMVADNSGFRMGNMVADNSGFRIGNLLVADDNGFKLGRFVADGQGVRFSGGPPRPGPFGAQRDLGGFHRGRPHGRDDEHHGRGRPGRFSQGDHGHRRGSRSVHDDHGHRRRSRSASSSSSSSSSSSEESAGSLPDYDNIKDAQLPVLKQSLLEWLEHPDQPVTKEAIRKIRDELKEAKAKNVRPSDAEIKSLKVDVKKLMRSFRDLKKSQKVLRKAAKAERKAIRKEEKRHRKEVRREERRMRKGKDRAVPSMPSGPSVPAIPSIPSIPSIPALPSMPPMPGPFTAPPRPATLSHEATQMRAGAARLQSEARSLEIAAEKVRGQIANRRLGEKARLQLQDHVTQLEEQAENMHREAVRMMAESLNIDRDGTPSYEQESGVIRD